MDNTINSISVSVSRCKNGYVLHSDDGMEIYTDLEELKKEVSRKIDQLAINRELEIAKITD